MYLILLIKNIQQINDILILVIVLLTPVKLANTLGCSYLILRILLIT